MIVTVDLDSTLCDTGHRHGLILQGDDRAATDWVAYSMACMDDKVVEATRVLIELLEWGGHEVHIVSGRSHPALGLTREWLDRNGIRITGELWLDDSEDRPASHAEYKLKKIYEVEQFTGQEVLLHVDDWAGVKTYLEEHGVACLCVRTPQEIEAYAKDDLK